MIEPESIFEHQKKIDNLRGPQQQRTQKRMEQVIEITRELLVTMGVEDISIPEISKQSGVPRTSIYQYFPSKYDLLSHIALIELKRIFNHLIVEAMAVYAEHRTLKLELLTAHLMSRLINASAEYYNNSPVASILILEGVFTRRAYLAQQETFKQISRDIRTKLAFIDADILPRQPDALSILVEVIFTCMKHGYYIENRVSEQICAEAYRLAIAYLYALKNNYFNMDSVPVKGKE